MTQLAHQPADAFMSEGLASIAQWGRTDMFLHVEIDAAIACVKRRSKEYLSEPSHVPQNSVLARKPARLEPFFEIAARSACCAIIGKLVTLMDRRKIGEIWS